MSTITTEGVQLRGAAAGDLDEIEALLRASSLPVDGVREHLGGFIVARSAGATVGVAGLEEWGGYGLLRSAAVLEEWRGRGVGRALVERVISRSRERGLRELFLLTTTAESYFPEFGFVLTQRETVPAPLLDSVEFRDACPSSATVMRLVLGGGG